MLLHLGHLDLGVTVGHVSDIFPHQGEKQVALFRIELAGPQPGVVQDNVVAERLGRCVVAGLGGGEHGLGTLFVSERLHEFETPSLLVLHHRHSLVLARVGDHRLRTHEGWRHHDLVAQHEVVDDQVVAVKLPAPRFVLGRLAHEREVVKPLVQFFEVGGDLAQRVVQAHDVAASLEALRAQPGIHQAVGSFALPLVQLRERHPLPGQGVLVCPAAPLRVIDRELRLAALLVSEGRQERSGGV